MSHCMIMSQCLAQGVITVDLNWHNKTQVVCPYLFLLTVSQPRPPRTSHLHFTHSHLKPQHSRLALTHSCSKPFLLSQTMPLPSRLLVVLTHALRHRQHLTH